VNYPCAGTLHIQAILLSTLFLDAEKSGAGVQPALCSYLLVGCAHWLFSSSFLMRAFSCSISTASEAVPLAGAI
jgi:hypothetical protein